MAKPSPSESRFVRLVRRVVMPIGLLVLAPPFTMMLWYTLTELDGSLGQLGALMSERGPLLAIWEVWSPRALGSPTAWTILAVNGRGAAT